MTEMDWLKQESGMTDEELKAMEAVAGSGKFKAFLVKAVAANTQAAADKAAAEQARIDLENRYTNEFIPEMRKVTTDALKAKGEAARLQAELAQAREYGIVPEEKVTPPTDPPRAPGSPDPNSLTREDLNRFSSAQSNTLIALNDLNAEHFRLFGQPLGNTQELVNEVQRQRKLGNNDFSLKQAWETKHNVSQKREELAKVEQTKHDDAIRAEERKKIAETSGPNGHLRSGRLSRFDTYKASDAGKEPWKAPHSVNERNRSWRENATAKIREAMAS